jgi:hypothetical protein
VDAGNDLFGRDRVQRDFRRERRASAGFVSCGLPLHKQIEFNAGYDFD